MAVCIRVCGHAYVRMRLRAHCDMHLRMRACENPNSPRLQAQADARAGALAPAIARAPAGAKAATDVRFVLSAKGLVVVLHALSDWVVPITIATVDARVAVRRLGGEMSLEARVGDFRAYSEPLACIAIGAGDGRMQLPMGGGDGRMQLPMGARAGAPFVDIVLRTVPKARAAALGCARAFAYAFPARCIT